ncbi:SpaH/EbpB family LPXTG-anchored major pilin [Clostridium intestinale]|uniref:SpaH/EbpB family LPXTG-anchored major pilin n=1 Tax=Clostridium intestinale TaxID=36845 RepID=UPI002DD6B9A9|nr:SpaH/EbpB family LPXTG-anchored major pilin [Clostridium intestinale]WRY50298.1 SpaH/EbpB family LPXTG-anchored major pilin [Clostridium intestinale]
MSLSKKILSFLLPLLMLISFIKLPASATEVSANCLPPEPTTRVTIHKVVGTSEFTLRDHNGSQLSTQQIAALGTNAVENNTGVEFTIWKVPAGTLVTDLNGKEINELNSIYTTARPQVVQAGREYSIVNGTYYVRETKHPATLKSSSGVPFIMELPALNVNSNGYLSDLHLYPKNVIENDMPEIDKDVQTKDNDHASYDVGASFDYLIYPKVPKGIESYTKFEIRDTLDSKLDYLDSITVTYNNITLSKGSDYTLTQSNSGTAGGNFTLTFTATGLQKLAKNRPGTETLKDLEIKYRARINNTATMGENIYNNATLIYNNGYNSCEKDVPDIKRPEVHTGGRQFIKVDNITQTYLEDLKTATFVVKNSENKYMKVYQGKVSWVPNISDAAKISLNPTDGSFEVTGLAYGNNGEEFTYSLVEVDVPVGYIKMNDFSFKISASSYGDGTSIYDNTKVTNTKKPNIPQTGGIGSIIFLAAGLLIMGSAVVALKRKKKLEN